MKLLVVSQYFYPEQFRINDVCFKLAEIGHEITVLTGLPNYPMGKIFKGYGWEELANNEKYNYDSSIGAYIETIKGVRVIRSNLAPRKTGKKNMAINYLSFWNKGSKVSSAMAKDTSKYSFDKLFVFQYSPVTMAIPAIKFKKIAGGNLPLYIYCFDLWPESIVAAGLPNRGPIYKAIKLLSKSIYKKADKIFLSSKNFEKYFNEKHNIYNNMEYLPIYAEDMFAECAGAEDVSGTGTINLLFAGNVGEMQSLDTIIRSADYLKHILQGLALESGTNTLPAVRFHIVGDGSALEKNISLAKELGLTDSESTAIQGSDVSVIFHGRHLLKEMPAFYAMADAFFVTLKNDPFISYTLPGKVQSYMASGKPLLAAINGETADVIIESGCGLVSPAEDFEALAENILKFISMEQKERRKYGALAKAYYDEHFSSDAFFKALLRILQ